MQTVIDCSVRSVVICSTIEKQSDTFLGGKLLFWTIFLSTPRVVEKWSYNLQQNCQNTLWNLTFYYSTRCPSFSVIWEKWARIFFFHRDDSLYLKQILVLWISLVLKTWLYSLNKVRQKTFWLLIKCSMTFNIINKMGKKLPKQFLIGKTAVFLKSCFCRPLRFLRNDKITCTTTVILPSGLIWVVPWGSSTRSR